MSNEPAKFANGQEVLVKATVIRDGPDNDNDVYISMIGSNVTVNRSTAYVLPSEIIRIDQPKPIDHDAIQCGDEVAVRGRISALASLDHTQPFRVTINTALVLVDKVDVVSHTPKTPHPPSTAAELAKMPPVVAERVYAELLRKAAKS